jgi:hypothetical protein
MRSLKKGNHITFPSRNLKIVFQFTPKWQISHRYIRVSFETHSRLIRDSLHFSATFNIPESSLLVAPLTIAKLGYKNKMRPPVKGDEGHTPFQLRSKPASTRSLLPLGSVEVRVFVRTNFLRKKFNKYKFRNGQNSILERRSNLFK